MRLGDALKTRTYGGKTRPIILKDEDLTPIMREVAPFAFTLMDAKFGEDVLEILPTVDMDEESLTLTVPYQLKYCDRDAMCEYMSWVIAFITRNPLPETPKLDAYLRSRAFHLDYRGVLTMYGASFALATDWDIRPYELIMVMEEISKTPYAGIAKDISLTVRRYSLNLISEPLASVSLIGRTVLVDPQLMDGAVPLEAKMYAILHELVRVDRSRLGLEPYGNWVQEIWEKVPGTFEGAVWLAEKGWKFRPWMDEWRHGLRWIDPLPTMEDQGRDVLFQIPCNNELRRRIKTTELNRLTYDSGMNSGRYITNLDAYKRFVADAIHVKYIFDRYHNRIFHSDGYDEAYVKAVELQTRIVRATSDLYDLQRSLFVIPDLCVFDLKDECFTLRFCLTVPYMKDPRTFNQVVIKGTPVSSVIIRRNLLIITYDTVTTTLDYRCDLQGLYERFVWRHRKDDIEKKEADLSIEFDKEVLFQLNAVAAESGQVQKPLPDIYTYKGTKLRPDSYRAFGAVRFKTPYWK